MKTKFEFIHFIQTKQHPKTSEWSCRNNRSNKELGIIKWYGPWRQYCFSPTVPADYSKGCLNDIASFIEDLQNKWIASQSSQ